MQTLVNLGLFQLGWFACVLGAAQGYGWPGPIIVGLALAVYGLIFEATRDWKLILPCAAIGLVFDSLLSATGLIHYSTQSLGPWIAPLWIVAMWANMALVLRHSLVWLEGRWLLSAVAGGVAGPLAYWSGGELGAISQPLGIAPMIALSVIWALALPFLFWLSDRMD